MSGATWIVLAALGGAGTVGPGPTPYELRWTRAPGAEGCIEAGELAERVAERLGRRVFGGAPGAAVVIDGEVRPGGAGWLVTVRVRGPGGEERGARDLEQVGPDCRALDRPLALVLALIIDLDLAQAVGPAPAPPAARRPWRFEATLAGSAGVGVVPQVGVGARAALVIDAPALWPVMLDASWWSAGEHDADAQGVRLRPWQVEALVCTPGRRLGPLRVAGCGGGGAERIAATGVGFDRNRDTSATVAVAAVRGRVAVELSGPAFVAGELGVDVRLNPPRFVFEDGGVMLLHQPARAPVAGAIGVGVRF